MCERVRVHVCVCVSVDGPTVEFPRPLRNRGFVVRPADKKGKRRQRLLGDRRVWATGEEEDE